MMWTHSRSSLERILFPKWPHLSLKSLQQWFLRETLSKFTMLLAKSGDFPRLRLCTLRWGMRQLEPKIMTCIDSTVTCLSRKSRRDFTRIRPKFAKNSSLTNSSSRVQKLPILILSTQILPWSSTDKSGKMFQFPTFWPQRKPLRFIRKLSICKRFSRKRQNLLGCQHPMICSCWVKKRQEKLVNMCAWWL